MRKVLAVDGCFLKGKYGGVLLAATAQDAERHIYPLAWCVVDSENKQSWKWFFDQLVMVVRDSDELSIISDRHHAIKSAIDSVYPNAHHGYCMRHLGENLKVKFKRHDIIKAYYAAAEAYRVEEMEKHFDEIRRNAPNVSEFLENSVGFRFWTRALFPGRRYDVMTTNIAESLNSRLLKEREYPIVALLDGIQKLLSEWYHERRTLSTKFNNKAVPSVETKLRDRYELTKALSAYPLNENEFSVKGYGANAVVNLLSKSCSCKVFDIEGLPCPHALKALERQGGAKFGDRIYSELVSPYYRSEYYTLAYAETIYPVPPEEQWFVPDELMDIVILPPNVTKKRGRKTVKRKPSAGELPRKRNRFSNCNRTGHKKRTCSNP